VQHEPDDVLVLVQAASAAGKPEAAAPAISFVHAQGQSDTRVDARTLARSAAR